MLFDRRRHDNIRSNKIISILISNYALLHCIKLRIVVVSVTQTIVLSSLHY